MMFEQEPASPYHVAEWWRKNIEESQAHIVILHNELSWPVFDEFKIACELSKPVFVFVSKEGSELLETERLRTDQRISEEERSWFLKQVKSRKYQVYEEALDSQIKDALSQYLSLPELLPNEISPYVLQVEDPENLKVIAVYVKPSRFDDAWETLSKRRLVIIAGSPYVGKSAMALYLAHLLRREVACSGIIKFAGYDDSLKKLKKVKNYIIIIDDLFGISELDYRVESAFYEILNLARANYLIITTNEDILNEAESKLRSGEMIKHDYSFRLGKMENKGETHDNKALLQVLRNHVDYYGINEPLKSSIRKEEIKIVRKLRFPPYYDAFVKELVASGDVDKALFELPQMKMIARWLLRMYDTNRSAFNLAVTVILFPDMPKEMFVSVYRKVLEYVEDTIADSPLVTIAKAENLIERSSFLKSNGTVGFKNPSYLLCAKKILVNQYVDRMSKFLLVFEDLFEGPVADLVAIKAIWALSSVFLKISLEKSLNLLKIPASLKGRENYKLREIAGRYIIKCAVENDQVSLTIANDWIKSDNSCLKWTCAYVLVNVGVEKVFSADILNAIKTIALDEKSRWLRYETVEFLLKSRKTRPVAVEPVLREIHKELELNLSNRPELREHIRKIESSLQM